MKLPDYKRMPQARQRKVKSAEQIICLDQSFLLSSLKLNQKSFALKCLIFQSIPIDENWQPFFFSGNIDMPKIQKIIFEPERREREKILGEGKIGVLLLRFSTSQSWLLSSLMTLSFFVIILYLLPKCRIPP